MINLYRSTEDDFSTNGLLVLDRYCLSAVISEELNSEYMLELELSNANNNYSNQIQMGMVLKAPAPVREEIALAELSFIRAYKATDTLYMYSNAKTSSKKLRKVKKGTVLFFVSQLNGSWLRMTTTDGKGGYVQASRVQFSSESAVGTGESVITPEMAKEQLFRIFKIEHTLESVKVFARHISYDLMNNYVRSLDMPQTTGASALDQLLAATLIEHDFEGYSDITRTATLNCSRKNPIECMYGEDLFGLYKGQFLRDNYNLYFLNNIGRNRGMSIAYRKNMTGLTVDVDASNVITRLVPIGADKKGKEIFVASVFVDSLRIDEYEQPRISERVYSDVKVGDIYKTTAAVQAELTRRAREEFDLGIDLPKIRVEVDFVDTDASTRKLRTLYLGDEIQVKHESYGFDLKVNVIGYSWDCLQLEYLSLSLGDQWASLSNLRIDPDLIPSNSLGNRTIGFQAVGPGALADGSVSEDTIQDEAVRNHHIANAEIDVAKIKDLSANIATIALAIIGEARIDVAQINQLSAYVAEIATAKIGEAKITTAQIENLGAFVANIVQANIGSAKIEIAQINDLTAFVAEIAVAMIADALIDSAQIRDLAATVAKLAQAEIGAADIDWAQIKDLVTGTAILREGVGGKLFIDRLSVNEANMVSLTTGELVVKGKDGKFYTFSVNEQGQVVTTEKQVAGDNIANETIPGGKLIENTITARELNVAQIFASSALIGAIRAGNIASFSIEGHHLSVDAISALNGALNLSANQSVRVMVSEAVEAAAETFAGQDLALRFDKGTYLSELSTSTGVSALVYANGLEVTETIPAACFVWTRASKDEEGDAAWNDAHLGLRSFVLTTQDIDFVAVIGCRIDVARAYPRFDVIDGELIMTRPEGGYEHDFYLVDGELVTDANGVYTVEEGALFAALRAITGTPTEATVVDRTDDPVTERLAAEIEITRGQIKLKADRETVDGLVTWKNGAEQRITPEAITQTVRSSTQYAQDMAGKADQAALTGLSGTVTQQETRIAQTERDIQSRVTRTELDALGNVVSQQGSTIAQMPEKINLAVEEVRTGAVPAGSVSTTDVKIDNKDGLRVDQKLGGSNIPTYFKANARQFGLYNTADNIPFFEAGIDGGGNGYSATTRLKDVRKASDFYASIEPNTILGNWHGGALALRYADIPLLAIVGLYGGWPGNVDAYVNAEGAGSRLNLQADGARILIHGSGVELNRPISFDSASHAQQTRNNLGALSASSIMAGSETITMKPSTAAAAVRVTFPQGGFAATPIVVCSLSFVSNAVSNNNSVFPIDITPDGFTIYYGHEASNTATVPVQWIAMLPT